MRHLASSTVHTATIRDTVARNASLSGFVYLDFNQSGIREPNERGIPGVIIELTGTDTQGESVRLRTLTANDGAYAFVDLRAGSYAISENHPGAFVDGDDSIGSRAASRAMICLKSLTCWRTMKVETTTSASQDWDPDCFP